MYWIALGVAVVLGIVGAAIKAIRRPVAGLGSVSDQWIAQHRADPQS